MNWIDAKRDEGLSRRALLKGSAALAVTSSMRTRAQVQSRSGEQKSHNFAYVGTYSGAAGNGPGIFLFEMTPANGALVPIKVVSQSSSPTWISLNPQQTHFYSADGATGSVSSFAIDRSNGNLTLLNSVSSEGARPAYLSVEPSGKFVLVANYGAGSVAVLPILPNGSLGPATDVHVDNGAIGPKKATDAPDGSFFSSAHDRPRPHFIQAAPGKLQSDGGKRLVLQTDLGQDRIYIYNLDLESGKLAPAAASSFVSLPAGDGPRHLAFHPNGQWVYSVQEAASTLVFFKLDAQAGSLAPQQTISTLPERFAGTNAASEVLISPGGRFLYAANRGHNSLVAFSIGHDGRLSHVSDTASQGDFPRSISMDPTGRFLYSCNHLGDNITCFRVNRKTGELAFTGQYTPLGSPACMLFLS